MPRAAVRSMPSVTSRERGFMSGAGVAGAVLTGAAEPWASVFSMGAV